MWAQRCQGHYAHNRCLHTAVASDAGIAMLPDGRVVVTGGVDNKHTSLYDPTAGGWAAGPPMHLGRGYQARAVLSDVYKPFSIHVYVGTLQ